MLGCCIRSEPCLINDDCDKTQRQRQTQTQFSVFKKVRPVVSPIQTPDFMIDLEIGLNHQVFVVYEPREIHKSVWVHGLRIAI